MTATATVVALDVDEGLVEVPLEACPTKSKPVAPRRISDGVAGLLRASFAFKPSSLGSILNSNLESEKAIPPQRGRGLTRRQSRMMDTIFDKLGKEEVIDNGDAESISSNLSDFVGGRRSLEDFSVAMSSFRHRLSLNHLNNSMRMETELRLDEDFQQPEQEPRPSITADSSHDSTADSTLTPEKPLAEPIPVTIRNIDNEGEDDDDDDEAGGAVHIEPDELEEIAI